MEKVKPTKIQHNQNTGHPIEKDKFFHKKQFLKNFSNSFDENELIKLIAGSIILALLISVIISIYKGDYTILKQIIELLISYFSISIGFSFTALIFIIQTIEKNGHKLLRKISALISFYIIHGLLLITAFIIEIVFGNLLKLNGFWFTLCNFVVYFFFITMILFNILLFYKIIKVVYHYVLSDLVKT